MEDEGEIEFLDEDEDVVHQYVLGKQSSSAANLASDSNYQFDSEDETPLLKQLLTERRGQKRTLENDDSDYTPESEFKRKKRPPRKTPQNKTIKLPFIVKTEPKEKAEPKTYVNKLKKLPNLTVKKCEGSVNQKKIVFKEARKIPLKTIEDRRKLGIRMPDFEDPLCLPLIGAKRDITDIRKLNAWNNKCLEKIRSNETSPLVIQNIDGTAQHVVLRNVKNKKTGQVETTVFHKKTSYSKDGPKIDSFQGILPKLGQKPTKYSYVLQDGNVKFTKHKFEAILTKEVNNDEETLVVYKPREKTSAVYSLDEPSKVSDDVICKDDEDRRVLRELTCAKMCAPCYHASWRDVRKIQVDNIKCYICRRSFVSVYNLLTHVKAAHDPLEIKKFKAKFSKSFASIMEYLYKCRLCLEKFNDIKSLKNHILKHQGSEVFKCEVGNHMTR